MAGFNIAQAKLLQDLVNDRLTPSQFLAQADQGEKPDYIEVLTSDECKKQFPDNYSHESVHEKVWNEYGVKVLYGKNTLTNQFMTTPENLTEIAKDFTKEKLINMAKNAYYATYKSGIRERVYEDLLDYEILSNNVSDELINKSEKEIKAWLKNKYPDLKD